MCFYYILKDIHYYFKYCFFILFKNSELFSFFLPYVLNSLEYYLFILHDSLGFLFLIHLVSLIILLYC